MSERRGQHDAGAADGADDVAGGQARPAAGPLGQPPDADRGGGRAEREQRSGQPGQAGRAEHVLGEQRADGHAGGQPRAGEDLRGQQDPQRAPLEGGDVVLGTRPGVGGRSSRDAPFAVRAAVADRSPEHGTR